MRDLVGILGTSCKLLNLDFFDGDGELAMTRIDGDRTDLTELFRLGDKYCSVSTPVGIRIELPT